MTFSRITSHQAPPFCFRDGGASAMGQRIPQTSPANVFFRLLPKISRINFYSVFSGKSSSPPFFSSNSKAPATNAKPNSKVSFFETNSTAEQQPQEFAQANYLAPFRISAEFAQANSTDITGDSYSSDARVCSSKLPVSLTDLQSRPSGTQEFAQANSTGTKASSRTSKTRVCSSKLHRPSQTLRTYSRATEFAQANSDAASCARSRSDGGVCLSKPQRRPGATRALEYRDQRPTRRNKPRRSGVWCFWAHRNGDLVMT